MQQFAAFRQRDGIFTKLFVIENAKMLAPSRWWNTYGSHLPNIQRVACTVFAQPVGTCAAERNWSIYGQIKGPARNRMEHVVADKRVFAHEALHFQNKLQSASYRQQVEGWSESDSSESGDDQHDLITHLLM